MPTPNNSPLSSDKDFLRATAQEEYALALALTCACAHYPANTPLRIRKGKGIVDAIIREPVLAPTRPLEIRLKVFNPATQKEYIIGLDQIENN